MWPVRLESFSCRLSSGIDYSREDRESNYDLDRLQRILAIRRNTLTHIEILQLQIFRDDPQSIERFNVTGFHSLQSLSLSHRVTGTATTFISDLMAPNLREFHWNMEKASSPGDEPFGTSLEIFQQDEEDWLRTLCTAAMYRESVSLHVQIHYRPDKYFYRPDGGVIDMEYPWDRIDRVRCEFQHHGITLSYDTPTLSRDQFRHFIDSSPRRIRSNMYFVEGVKRRAYEW